MILLYMQYGFFEDDKPIIIMQPPISLLDKSDKPIVIVPSSVSEPEDGVQKAEIDNTVKP